ncbi:CapA family protein [Solibacillus silvestris]|uniref:CapA family protein n=1 Tax=Solibacillus silvestris TaxID=76853 RepID=UPI003F7F8BDF
MTNLFICGDIVNCSNNEEICDRDLKEIITKSDYAICNFEAPINNSGSKAPKLGIHLQQKRETVEILKNTGFKLLCLSNNHIMDYGTEALNATIKEIESNRLDHIGAGLDFMSAYKPLIKQFGDAKIGFINCCEAQFGVLDNKSNMADAGYAWINHRLICKLVLELKKECDLIILLAHAGLEDVSIPQIEWREKYKLFCDLGVDLVVGSHPHVPQGFEKYNNSYIFYSLGNFYFDEVENFIGKKDSSYSISIKIAEKKIQGIQFVYHYTQNNKVCLAAEHEVDIEGLNKLLGKDYKQLHKKITNEAYANILKATTIFTKRFRVFDKSFIGNMITGIKSNNAVRRIFNKSEIDKNIAHMHYIRNESYYYVIKNVLIDRVYK